MSGYVEFIYMRFAIHLGFYLKFYKRNTSLKWIQILQLLGTKKTGRGEQVSSSVDWIAGVLSGR